MEEWLRFSTFAKHQGLVQSEQFDTLRSLILRDYPNFSGHELEAYFRDLLVETRPIGEIGSWWEKPRGKSEGTDQHEIDIVAVHSLERKVLIAEVKRQRTNFEEEKFMHKMELIKNRLFSRYVIETDCFTLEDM